MPSPEEYFAVVTAFKRVQVEIQYIKDRVAQRFEFTKTGRTETELQEKIEDVEATMSDLRQVLDDFYPDEEVGQDLKEDIQDLLPVLEAFSRECALVRKDHWESIEATHSAYIKLNAKHRPMVGEITRRGSDGTAQRVLARPGLDRGTKKMLRLLLRIYDVVVDYWLLWRWVYTYLTAAEIRGDHQYS